MIVITNNFIIKTFNSKIRNYNNNSKIRNNNNNIKIRTNNIIRNNNNNKIRNYINKKM